MVKRLIHFIARRLFSRHHVRVPITFMVVNGMPVTGAHNGVIVDLSKNGCCVEVDKLSFDGFHLLKCLEDVDSYRVRILHEDKTEFSGNLRWINSDTEGKWHGFKIGIEFVSPITNATIALLPTRKLAQATRLAA